MAETTGAGWVLSDAEVADGLVEVWKREQVLAARRLVLVREAAVRDLARRCGATSLAMWLSGLLRVSGGKARQMADLANALDTFCAATAQALAQGVINEAQALVIAKAMDQIKDVGATVQQEAEAALLSERCAGFEPVTLGKAAARVLDHVAPHLAEEKLRKDLERAEKLASRDRALSWSSFGDGTGRHRLSGVFGAEDTAVIKSALSALTQPAGQDDTRTPAQRAADALADICRYRLASGDLPEDGGDAASVVVTMNLADLTAAVGAGTLDTGDQIGPEAVRRLACCAQIIPAVLGDHHVPIDLGRARRLFTGGARRALVLRDRGCAFPGCDRPPKWCEGHHCVHWLHGGRTDLSNGVLLCRHHHRVIHQGEWTVRVGGDGHPEFLPPLWLDPLQVWRRNTFWSRH